MKYPRELYKGKGWEEKATLSLVASYLPLSLHKLGPSSVHGRAAPMWRGLGVLAGSTRQKQDEVAGTGAEQQYPACQGLKSQPQTPPNTQSHSKARFPAETFLGCWIQPRTQSQPCQGTQLQDRHCLVTVNAFSSLNINKTKICFYNSQPPKVLTPPQNQFAVPHNAQAPQSWGGHLPSLLRLNRKTNPGLATSSVVL